ncbi:MAG: hypothetical protein COV48_06060 [Elusimicrobia bacterium CG11_big_fil_rev_8_21_14_0_20_64_6]|nr:MAG: hypothetical protein COV48_06060 [Elusimicrobia bacterium CG11_big_fil_rev_8_21_14_0_20_64_6]
MNEERRLQRMELFEVLTVGLPFCGFKILTGVSLAAAAPLQTLGTALIVLGVFDGAINIVNLLGLIASGRRPIAACSLALATRPWSRASGARRKWTDLGNSLDVLLSFGLVSLMIGYGRLGSMPAGNLAVWNTCVILNVLGAGLGRFSDCLRDLRRDAAK